MSVNIDPFAFLTHNTFAETIQTAAGDGDLEAVKRFIANGKSVNDQDGNGYSALHAACSYGQVEVAKYLLDNGAEPCLRDEDGDSPLHMCESPECAKLLIEHGASPSDINGEGITCVRYAVEEQFDEMIEFYILIGALSQKELESILAEIGEENLEEYKAFLKDQNMLDETNANTTLSAVINGDKKDEEMN